MTPQPHELQKVLQDTVNDYRSFYAKYAAGDASQMNAMEAGVSQAVINVLAAHLVASLKACPTCLPGLVDAAVETLREEVGELAPRVRAMLEAQGLVAEGSCQPPDQRPQGEASACAASEEPPRR